jgi:HAD superfamily hydrolase (TIGR01509 family)
MFRIFNNDLIKRQVFVMRKMIKSPYDAVVFDMDGVIFDSEKAVLDCWVEVARQYGITNIEQVCLDSIGTTAVRTREIVLEAYGNDFPYEEISAKKSRMFHEKYDGGRLPMKEGVVELLTFLRNEGKKIALASSTRREVVTAELRDAHILEYFDEVICGDMVERSKPAPDIFLKACQALHTEPERTYAIEDSYNGIKAAHAGNLRPIMVPDLLPCNDEVREMTEAVFDSLLEVKEELQKMKEKYKV